MLKIELMKKQEKTQTCEGIKKMINLSSTAGDQLNLWYKGLGTDEGYLSYKRRCEYLQVQNFTVL